MNAAAYIDLIPAKSRSGCSFALLCWKDGMGRWRQRYMQRRLTAEEAATINALEGTSCYHEGAVSGLLLGGPYNLDDLCLLSVNNCESKGNTFYGVNQRFCRENFHVRFVLEGPIALTTPRRVIAVYGEDVSEINGVAEVYSNTQSAEARDWWAKLATDYGIHSASKPLLAQAS